MSNLFIHICFVLHFVVVFNIVICFRVWWPILLNYGRYPVFKEFYSNFNKSDHRFSKTVGSTLLGILQVCYKSCLWMLRRNITKFRFQMVHILYFSLYRAYLGSCVSCTWSAFSTLFWRGSLSGRRFLIFNLELKLHLPYTCIWIGNGGMFF